MRFSRLARLAGIVLLALSLGSGSTPGAAATYGYGAWERTIVPTPVAVQLVSFGLSDLPTQPPVDQVDACAITDRSRFKDCRSHVYSFNLRASGNNAVIGTLMVALTVSETVATNSRAWSAHYTARFFHLTGAARVGTTATVLATCQGPCVAPGAAIVGGAPVAENAVLQGDVAFSSSSPSTSQSSQTINVYLFNPAAAGVGTTDGPESTLGPIRCDNAAVGEGNGGNGTPGCVVANFVPTLELNAAGCSGSGCPIHAAFVARAQNDPKTAGYGRPGSGKPLTREVSTDAEQRAKRRQVCSSSWPRNPSPAGTPPLLRDSCDEYPYSSTYQGIPRYAVTGHVPLGDNTQGGIQLGIFYARNHILDGDAFYVRP